MFSIYDRRRRIFPLKLKKPIFVLALLLLLGCLVLSPLSAFAVNVDVSGGSYEILPGHTQFPTKNYNKAWLDNLIIRDGSTALTAVKLTPKPEYPYSETYDSFCTEVSRFSKLHDLNEDTVGTAYYELINAFYYMVTAMGMTDKTSGMKAYLEDYGIAVPTKPNATEKAEIAGVYAALKYNAPYVLYEKEVTLPKGTTLEGAEVALVSELMDVFLPSGVNTVNGLAVQAAKSHVEEFPEIPISENPSNSEVFHWSKVLTAASNDYEVPMTTYDQTSAAQREYVDYAYYASIFDKIYDDIHVDPTKLAAADMSGDPTATQKVVLGAMLDSKGVAYAPEASCQQLFETACAAGCFELDQEFYSDVFEYEALVPAECTQLWFTPFALASQLGGSDEYVSMSLNGKALKPSGTTFVDLDPNRIQQTVELVSSYDDGINPVQQAVYRFNVVFTDGDVNNSDILNDFQTMVDRVSATEGENTERLVDIVSDYAGAQVSDSIFHTLPQTPPVFSGEMLTTFGDVQNAADGQAPSGNNSDFGYLGRFIDETYPEDETAVTSSLLDNLTTTDESHAPSLVVRTGQAIMEHPQIVAAPTGIIALGGLLGYFFSRKRKNVDPLEQEEDEIEDIDL